MTEPDPIDFQAWSTPDPSPSLTRDILDRVGHASSAPERATPRLAMIAAAVVAAAAAAMIIWKLRGAGPERGAPAIAVDERATESDTEESREARSTPLTPHLRRLVSAEARTRLLADISTARAQGGGHGLPLSRADIQQAMEEVRPLLAECHEMARERTPGLAGTLRVKMTLVGEPGLATVVAEAEAEPDEGLAGEADFLECVTETILSLELAAPVTGGTMTVTYPFVFRARSEETGARPGPTHRLPSTNPADPAPGIGSLVDEARAAAKVGEWDRALALAKEALAQHPADQGALMVGVLAACNVNDADSARDYTSRLSSPARQGMARQSCLRKGIEVGDD